MAKKKRKRGRVRKWIQKAIKRPGALTKKLHGKLGRIIVGATKKPLWTKKGDINTNTLRSFTKTEAYEKLDPTTKRQIRLAITLQKMANRRKKK